MFQFLKSNVKCLSQIYVPQKTNVHLCRFSIKTLNNHQITSQEEQYEHQSRGIYLRDDHCDWGSSGMNEFTEEFTQKN